MPAKLTYEQILEKFTARHGERYDYSRVEYQGSRYKVVIGCSKHGWFRQFPYDHIYGSICPKCADEESAAKRTFSQETFIAAARAAHGDRYDYSRTRYVAAQERCEVICREHGPFMVMPSEHTQGRRSGCPKCGKVSMAKIAKERAGYVLDKAALQERITRIHGDGYLAITESCSSASDMLSCWCPAHGEFSRVAIELLKSGKNKGCPACGLKRGAATRKITHEEFFARSTAAHKGAYDYSASIFTGLRERIEIACPEHGAFSAHAETHMRGASGCPECHYLSTRATTEEFISKARKVHGDTFDYDRAAYTMAHDPIIITCKKHGDFEVAAYAHTNGSGFCPRCGGGGTSKQEKDLGDFLLSTGQPWTVRSKRVIPPQELDFYLPEKSLAIEYCGVYWHSEANKPTSYHLDKLQAAENRGIRLLTLFEDEWLEKTDIVKAVLGRLTGGSELLSIGARLCNVVQIPPRDAAAFYLRHHLQGFAPAETHLGLFFAGELVAAASFAKPRIIYGGARAPGEVELVRFCQHQEVSVSGALGKLCAAYARSHPDARQILSYVDRRWFTGKTYMSSGFSIEKLTAPGYFYVKAQQRHSRFKFAKHRLPRLLPNYDPALSEHENMRNHGYLRLYDCGQIKLRKILA